MQDVVAFLAKVKPPITPALVIRRAAFEANLARLQAECTAKGVRLRPHGKMHKSSRIALAQLAGGAVGLCCQTVGEAESYVAAGVPDVLVTAPVPPWGWPRLAALAGRATVGAVVDSLDQLANAFVAARDADALLHIYVDVDPGMGRAGVAPEAVPVLAGAISLFPNLNYAGIQAYCGHHQHLAPAERGAAHAAWSRRLESLVDLLHREGLPPALITGGGTGTAALDLAAGIYDELQAGSYALMDVEYGDLGDLPFQPALFLAATVVSARHETHVTCDAGHKALHPNGPPQRVVWPEGSQYRPAGDEHGAILPPNGAGEGDLVWLQPGHVDPTVALHDAFFLADEDGGLERWPIDARRSTT